MISIILFDLFKVFYQCIFSDMLYIAMTTVLPCLTKGKITKNNMYTSTSRESQHHGKGQRDPICQ